MLLPYKSNTHESSSWVRLEDSLIRHDWLVVDLPIWKNDGLRQLGWWHSIYEMEIIKAIKAMFETTNQKLYTVL